MTPAGSFASCCQVMRMTLQPAATVPCGLTAAGLPVGLQIVGPMHRDDLVLRASRAFEAIRPWPTIAAPRALTAS